MLLSAYSKLSWAYLYDQKQFLALSTAREARDILEQRKESLPACIRGGTYSTLSVMQSRCKQNPDTALKKSIEQDPGDEVIAYMAFTRQHIPLEQGQTYFYAGLPVKALEAYSQVVNPESLTLMPQYRGLSERERVDTLLGMARASLKGDARDMEKAIHYWKAVMKGAVRLQNESMFNGAILTFEMLEIAFPNENQIRDLQDLTEHW